MVFDNRYPSLHNYGLSEIAKIAIFPKMPYMETEKMEDS